MQPGPIGGHPALDFLNTWFQPGGEPVERIGDGRALVEWLREAGLLDAEPPALARRLGASGLDAAAAELREFREWARAWLARWRERPGADHAAELRHLNAILAAAPVRWELVEAPTGRELLARHRVEAPEHLLGRVALEVARLVAEEDPRRVGRCAGTACTLWFLDRTRAGRRRYCSASGCGNRAKVTAFRQRQREER